MAYDIGQHGWSSFTLRANGRAIEIGRFGYCTDALGDLIRAALLVATGGLRAEARFDGEPVEWRLILGEPPGWVRVADLAARPPLPPSGVRLRVLSFDSYLSDLPEKEGATVLDTYVTGDAFARAVQKAARSIWDTHGPCGYNELWTGPKGFPLRALKALDAALEHQDPPARGSENELATPISG